MKAGASWPHGLLFSDCAVIDRCDACNNEDAVASQWIFKMSKQEPGKIIGNRFVPVSEMTQDQLREIIDSPVLQNASTLLDAAKARLFQEAQQ
jgi:hypothetical protein